MRVEFVANTFIDFDVGYRVRLQGRELVIVQYSIEKFPPYTKYQVELAWPEKCGPFDKLGPVVNLDEDLRIMSMRTSGFSPFDFETMRGTATESPIAELARWFSETGIAEDRIDRASFIRAEVEAMDWPEVITVPWLP